ncbi:MAG: hypothetical protein C4293_06165 [Nitrospiraceae bacterium]
MPRPVVIAVDIPIGLLDRPEPGGRPCDREARCLLRERRSSIFSPPARSQLRTISGMSRQTLMIRPKIIEIDRVMTPQLQGVVHESHPELAFTALAGHPMMFAKKAMADRDERRQALEQGTQGLFQDIGGTAREAVSQCSRRQVAVDDLFDAVVLAWTARRIYHGTAMRIPTIPLMDRKGLRMEIWF